MAYVIQYNTLYSIGHGHKTAEEFIDELRSFSIQYIVDVRTSPYSKWAPQFNRGVIEQWLSQAGIKYGYMGDMIGGKPQNDSCYDDEGHFDYHKMAEMPRFKEGLNRLVIANNEHFMVGIMCTETDPTQCHRSKLIGRELYFNHEIDMSHIIAIGKSVKQSEIMTELTKGKWSPEGNLFGNYDPPFLDPEKHTRIIFLKWMNTMINVFTIGVYGSTEESFFGKLTQRRIDLFCDIRQRRGVRGSQYKYVNSNYLQAKLFEMGIKYLYVKELAPTKEIRQKQKDADKLNNETKKQRTSLGNVFVSEYNKRILNKFDKDNFIKDLNDSGVQNIVLFCVEEHAEACHRSLVAQSLANELETKVVNL